MVTPRSPTACGEVPVQVQLVGANRVHPGGHGRAPAASGACVAVPAPEVRQVLDRGKCAGVALEVAGAGFEPVRRRPHLVRRQPIADLALPVHRADVRAEELVDGAGDEVRVHGAGIHREVWRRVHGIDVHPRADRVRALRDLGDGIDRAHGIGRPADGDKLRALVEDGVEVIESQGAVGEIRLPGPDDHLVVAVGGDPRVHVAG
jgi:hypothetical protein